MLFRIADKFFNLFPISNQIIPKCRTYKHDIFQPDDERSKMDLKTEQQLRSRLYTCSNKNPVLLSKARSHPQPIFPVHDRCHILPGAVVQTCSPLHQHPHNALEHNNLSKPSTIHKQMCFEAVASFYFQVQFPNFFLLTNRLLSLSLSLCCRRLIRDVAQPKEAHSGNPLVLSQLYPGSSNCTTVVVHHDINTHIKHQCTRPVWQQQPQGLNKNSWIGIDSSSQTDK